MRNLSMAVSPGFVICLTFWGPKLQVAGSIPTRGAISQGECVCGDMKFLPDSWLTAWISNRSRPPAAGDATWVRSP